MIDTTSATSACVFRVPRPSAVEHELMHPRDSGDVHAPKSWTFDKGRDVEGRKQAVASSDNDESVYISISPHAFLKAMWTLLVSCFTEPLSVTVIDVTTGEKVEGQ